MRIFQVIAASANRNVPWNRTWHRNLYEPLADLGHEVFLMPADEGREALKNNNAQQRAQFTQKMLESFYNETNNKPFDLFFSYLMDGMVDPAGIDEIRNIGIPTCNFSCNNAHQFYLVDELSPHFDYNLHSEKDAKEKFLKIGANPLWWPMASNPKYFRPLDLPRTVAVSFVGANYALRAQYITHLLENGIDAHIYGPGWLGRWRSNLRHYLLLLEGMISFSSESWYRISATLLEHDQRLYLRTHFPTNLHAPIEDDDLISLYSRSQISLGFLEVYDQHDPSRPVKQHIHLREFEAPMSGALYCTGYTDELAEMFEPDKEILTYRNQHELLDKVRYYLKHPEQGDKIRHAGHKRALRDHTYQQRFSALFRQIGLKGK